MIFKSIVCDRSAECLCDCYMSSSCRSKRTVIQRPRFKALIFCGKRAVAEQRQLTRLTGRSEKTIAGKVCTPSQSGDADNRLLRSLVLHAAAGHTGGWVCGSRFGHRRGLTLLPVVLLRHYIVLRTSPIIAALCPMFQRRVRTVGRGL
jgi:hypothetical protein